LAATASNIGAYASNTAVFSSRNNYGVPLIKFLKVALHQCGELPILLRFSWRK
jgi:hypothetical protein